MGGEAFHQSLQRSVEREDFFDQFYAAFVATSPEIEAMFAHTDMVHQKRALKVSLYMIAVHGMDRKEKKTMESCRGLRRRHHELGIQRPHYEMWLDALIATVAACDYGFDADVETSWRAVMGNAINLMLAEDDQARTTTGPTGG